MLHLGVLRCLGGCPWSDCFIVIDLQQWESVFLAIYGFRNCCIKSGYEKSRVTSRRHDALCA